MATKTRTTRARTTAVADQARSLVEAVGRRDIGALRANWDEESVNDFVVLGTFRGREALTAFFKELFAALPELAMEVEGVVADGDTAVVQWRLTGTHSGAPFQGIAPTGRSIDLRGVDVMTFDGEHIRLNTVYYDGAAFARQVGLLPAQGSTADKALLGAFNAATAAKQRLRRR
jgi:steroid delta-isomerase-like uncharacterized protein